MKQALLRGRLNEFGALLHDEWEAKKQLSEKISTPHVEMLCAEARRAGAVGGKVAGAGGGGFLLLYCPFDRRHRIAQRLSELGCTLADFAFTGSGVQTWSAGDD